MPTRPFDLSTPTYQVPISIRTDDYIKTRAILKPVPEFLPLRVQASELMKWLANAWIVWIQRGFP